MADVGSWCIKLKANLGECPFLRHARARLQNSCTIGESMGTKQIYNNLPVHYNIVQCFITTIEKSIVYRTSITVCCPQVAEAGVRRAGQCPVGETAWRARHGQGGGVKNSCDQTWRDLPSIKFIVALNCCCRDIQL